MSLWRTAGGTFGATLAAAPAVHFGAAITLYVSVYYLPARQCYLIFYLFIMSVCCEINHLSPSLDTGDIYVCIYIYIIYFYLFIFFPLACN